MTAYEPAQQSRARRILNVIGALIVVLLLMRVFHPILWLRLTMAEGRWQRQALESYSIEIDDNEGNWGRRHYLITVENGEVSGELPCSIGSEEMCEMDPHLAQFFTVESLFDRARGPYRFSSINRVSFDPTYGYPTRIYSNSLTLMDAKSDIRVVDFQTMP